MATRRIPLAVAEAADDPVVTAEGTPTAWWHVARPHQPRAYLPASDASLCQFLVLLPGQCAQILLPSRCHKDQRPDRRPGDQASDLHFLVAGAGFEPATSGL